MRIYLTSVDESNRKDEIQAKIQKIFPEYKVVVIPNRYATKEGKEKVQAYAKNYYEKNKESILAKKKERDFKKKAEKEMKIVDEFYELKKKNKSKNNRDYR